MAVSAAEYILNELYWTEGETVASFSYPRPALRNQTYNANFLAAALLSRVHKITGEKKFIEPALRAARHSVSHQRKDGSWYYGADSTQAWIDNFHTAYNLCALRSIGQYAETTEFEPSIRRGLEFYIANFVHEDGSVKYFHDRTYPIDTHCIAQTIITLLTLQDLNPDNVRLAHQVFQWTMDHMWDDRGYFYYQVHRYFTNRTSYMRHTQAWMFLALATLLCDSKNAGERDPQPSTVLAER
jgi:hypothetical protein